VTQIANTAFFHTAVNGHKRECSIICPEDGVQLCFQTGNSGSYLRTLQLNLVLNGRTCLVILIASFKEIKLQGDAPSSSDQTPEAL
jgi:hypothetical protein